MPIEKTLLFAGRKISYQIVGDGPAVVLLHGVPFDRNLWMPLVNSASVENGIDTGKFKFIIPDLPGSGSSEMIDEMTMEGMAEVIKKIIDIENSKNGSKLDSSADDISNSGGGALVVSTNSGDRKGVGAVLIGHSMGGYISLAFAEKFPLYLRGLGLFHSTAYADSEERRAIRKEAIETIKGNGAKEFLKTVIPNLFSPHSRGKIPGTIDQFVEKTNNFSPVALVSYYEAMMRRPDRTSVLKNLKIPMLFVGGKYDNAAPLNDVLELCHLPEISYFHILEDVGHMGMVEEAERSKNILSDYLINVF